MNMNNKHVILCEDDYYRCQYCKKTILQAELQEFGDYKYHLDCPVCPGCAFDETMTTDTTNYFEYQGKLYCQYHYSLIKGVNCDGCGQALLDNNDETLEKWHTECYMIYKYWQVTLKPHKMDHHNYSNKDEFMCIQHEYEIKRYKIWKVLAQFENDSSMIIKNIIITKQYSACHELVHQISILFQVLDYLYSFKAFGYEKQVQLLLDQEFMVKMANLISQYLRELVKLSLQYTLLLEKENKWVMDGMLDIYLNDNHTICFDYLNYSIQSLKMALKEQEVSKSDKTIVRPPFLSTNKMLNESVPNIHLQQEEKVLRRSVSTATKHDTNINRIKRALTTRKTNPPSLHISLSDIQQASPPISPPSSAIHQHVWTIPNDLPQLNLIQDAMIRHTALLFIESSVEDFVLDDYLPDIKKSSSSLWNKLKAHILTPGGSSNLVDLVIEKRIGVSLSNLNYTTNDNLDEPWLQQFPLVTSCFSNQAQVPSFIQDCVSCIIQQDIRTEGVFRKNGNIKTLKEMCETLDTQGEMDWKGFFGQHSIIQLTAFIKKFLRELPEPLLTFKLHKLFMKAANDIVLLHYALLLLPKPNRDTFLLVLALLHWVAKHADDNKMDVDNLARVMTPNILYPEVPDDVVTYLTGPKLTEHVFTHHIDLTSLKQFRHHFGQLLKIKKEMVHLDSTLPSSPPSPPFVS
ncbi:hypothetical protein G6F61_006044 [Rhizopus arrhizus]|nr:hypothetical protein G6F23_004892 [Rhizopus arrhizus]KAG0767180.1 hypothetical protein G6F24_003013 [Rhizopus arrhizus]KAG0938859.1 hypothetical protein G6F32_009306 [Rhizopus arrhizus]KAG1291512.1 hypothetical protein G6F66_007753 [Rhizopus arrhizus]KAG1378208.1 hypothetical protein G6F61_006044 [Rhizopus arrhizus]